MDKRTAWLVGISGAALLFGPGLIQLARLSWQRRVLDRDVRRLEAAHAALLQERGRLTSDAVYVEGLIRSTFKVAKPGELVVPLGSDENSH